MSTTKEIAFWDCDDGETLIHTDRNDAIEEYLNKYLHPQMKAHEVLDALPKEVEVKGYVRAEVDRKALHPLTLLLEALEDEYGVGEEPIKRTEEMIAAEAALIDAVLAVYEPFWCEDVVSEKINVESWVKEYRPDWLEDT